MYCNKCGAQLPLNSGFCTYCGSNIEAAVSQLAPVPHPAPPQSTGLATAGLILGIIGLLLSFIPIFNIVISAPLAILAVIFGCVMLFKKAGTGRALTAVLTGGLAIVVIVFITFVVDWDFILDELDGIYTDGIYYESIVEGSSENEDEPVANSPINGRFSREIFSGNSFKYRTWYDSALFTFFEDSTFEIVYDDGPVYRGTFSVYNGLFIHVKAREIEENPPEYYVSSEQISYLVDGMVNVTNAMIAQNPTGILDVYLLYMLAEEMDENGVTTQMTVPQPYLIKYDPESGVGETINIFAATSGELTLMVD